MKKCCKESRKRRGNFTVSREWLLQAMATLESTYTRLTALCPGRTTLVSQYQKGKLIWTVLNQETVASAGPYASLHLAITTPAPHHSVFTGRMPLLPPNQQCQSTEGIIHTTDDKPVNCYTPFAKFICWHYMDWKRNMALITMLVNSPVYL